MEKPMMLSEVLIKLFCITSAKLQKELVITPIQNTVDTLSEQLYNLVLHLLYDSFK